MPRQRRTERLFKSLKRDTGLTQPIPNVFNNKTTDRIDGNGCLNKLLSPVNGEFRNLKIYIDKMTVADAILRVVIHNDGEQQEFTEMARVGFNAYNFAVEMQQQTRVCLFLELPSAEDYAEDIYVCYGIAPKNKNGRVPAHHLVETVGGSAAAAARGRALGDARARDELPPALEENDG